MCRNVEGFVSTEIGEIPLEWEIKRIGDIGEVITGSTPKTSESENYGDDFLWVSPFDLGASKYISKTNKKLSKIGFKKTRLLPQGSILVTCIGSTIGKMGIAGETLSTNQQINALACNNEVYNEYAYYSIMYNFKYYSSFISHQAVPIINKTTFSDFKLPVPPIGEQQKIANILSTVDQQIEQTDALIEKTKELKKGLMQRLLTKGIGHTEYRDTEIGRIPKEWEVKRLGEIAEGKGEYGIGASATEYIEGNARYLRITDIGDDGKLLNTDIKGLQENNYIDYLLQENDIVFARTGNTTGKTYLYDIRHGELVYAGFLIRFKIKSSIMDSRFVKYFVQTKKYWDWIKVMSTRSGQPGINSNEYATLKIPVPPIIEQNKISDILSVIDENLVKYEDEVEKLSKVKKVLMQQLITGKIRVNV